ncbi:long-chain fatty acid--CoA ligase [Ureibacillus massiliensis 4400831 = CIP 108448 = CCUG 49529]|uniref:Long-chain fatty acid--CoA ligase n=2 Tax=cellular organisms TaxID=131567 RepID=A0A0A3J1K7_9BACL|nr:long-chain-fatty-acid--CoA ligase [Ureibacillus massiliensis]KGR90781.1 long-chain fatty acid--CoA ligase [Ureibacillus massiliensis 4400831 = CIP 108448 = CCUG 49529]
MNLAEQVKQIVMSTPHKKAYHYQGKDTSYIEFDQLVGTLAFSLQKVGIKKGDHIAFLLGNTPDFLISLYACMRIGATAVPINPIFTLDEISYIFNNGDIKSVIAHDTLLPMLDEGKLNYPKVETFIVCESSNDPLINLDSISKEMKNRLHFFSDFLSESSLIETFDIQDEDTAIILYTSGTTGKPKGAELTHVNLFANARDVAHFMKFTAEDRVIATLPIFHVFALTVVINAPLFVGATILIALRFSPSEIFTLAKSQEATVFAGVPTMYNFLYQYPKGNAQDFSTLRMAISGGAPLPHQVLHNFEEKFNVRISEGYGLSEASPVTCFNALDAERKVGSIGKSITNVENKVVDEQGCELPPNVVGELIVRGPNVMKGYYKMPEETAKTLRDGWLYTGDLAKKDDEGYFYIVDRKKDMINVGGFKVYPREVEEVLYQFPEVLEAAVIGKEDEDFGEVVYAFVVLKDNGILQEELIEYCSRHLAKYKIPKVIKILEALPKSSTGKILRRTLKEMNF